MARPRLGRGAVFPDEAAGSRYQEVAEQLIAAGHAYRDYMPKPELDALRAQQSASGEKPRYDGAGGQNVAQGTEEPEA